MHLTVYCLAQSSRWGRALERGNIAAILAVVVIVAAVLFFYAYMNQNAAWAAFLTFLVLDCGVNFLSLAAILSRPFDLVAPNDNHQTAAASAVAAAAVPSVEAQQTESLLRPIIVPEAPDEEQDHSNQPQDESWRPLTPTQSMSTTPESATTNLDPHTVLPTNEILDLTRGDSAITVHTVVFFVCFVSSVLSDNLATFLPASPDVATVRNILWFLALDGLEDFLYCAGILVLAVSYRTTALQVWHLYHTIEDAYHHLNYASLSPSTIVSSNRNNIREAEASLTMLRQCLATYEQIFDRTEVLSTQTTPIAVCIVSFVALEMASTVTDVFEEKEFDVEDIAHLAMLRLLLVLSALILQIALAAADVIYASERLAEVLARYDAYWRLTYAQQVVTVTSTGAKATAPLDGGTSGNDTGYGSLDTTTSTNNHLAALAALCKAFGDRARSHPVRLRVSWFHLETEWSLGLAFLVVTVMLAVIGVKLPGGE